jgi:hypothetical protein
MIGLDLLDESCRHHNEALDFKHPVTGASLTSTVVNDEECTLRIRKSREHDTTSDAAYIHYFNGNEFKIIQRVQRYVQHVMFKTSICAPRIM